MRDLRQFGYTVGGVLTILGAVLWYFSRPSNPYFLGIGIILIVAAALAPNVLRPLQKTWMTIAVVLGWVMTRLLLSVMFYLVFAPISLISRGLGHQFIERRWDRSASTYWNKRDDDEIDKTSCEKQF